ncbi:RsfA family transcriptional regulator [Geomicrobium sp. JCM 19038]|uniref:RsfA family transcriptional regulator n=1 Tax=Geomicrobium sp. JCM 19038 TaxID=1460635 RepID=UPI00045F2DDE|nr:RsfA family transcriptional regulator [Geomicrobium sp. JCM 19038]GAK07413.1 prespore specific transcriptional activator RsfA [Geomicrobium sp. JCM 19038]
MTAIRQDAWSQEEDQLLSDLVLAHIREGKTQLQAFEEVGSRLKRTAAACGFRWNATIRKQYTKEIEAAKENRHYEQAHAEVASVADVTTKTSSTLSSMKDVIDYLQTLDESELYTKRIESELQKKQLENEALVLKLTKVERELKAVQHDYQSFISLLEKAKSHSRI